MLLRVKNQKKNKVLIVRIRHARIIPPPGSQQPRYGPQACPDAYHSYLLSPGLTLDVCELFQVVSRGFPMISDPGIAAIPG